MGYLFLSSIGGVFTGTVIGSIAADNKELGIEDMFTWRLSLLFPAVAFFFLAITWW